MKDKTGDAFLLELATALNQIHSLRCALSGCISRIPKDDRMGYSLLNKFFWSVTDFEHDLCDYIRSSN